MKKHSTFRVMLATSLILAFSIGVMAQRTTPSPTITIGSQSGTLTAGTAGAVTFTLTTNVITRVRAGSVDWYSDDRGQRPGSAPLGVTTNLTISTGGPRLLEVKTATGTLAGTYYFRVNMDGVQSNNVGILVVNSNLARLEAGQNATIIDGVPLHKTDFTLSDGVAINGLIWAKFNVDGRGVFSTVPYHSYVYFRYNSNKQWVATTAFEEWNNGAFPRSTAWETANDPCPSGWRVPTKDEFASLLDETKVTLTWGIWYGNLNNYPYKGLYISEKGKPDAHIFLPMVGALDVNTGQMEQMHTFGYYWTNTAIPKTNSNFHNAYGIILWYAQQRILVNEMDQKYGFALRCVKI